MVANAWHMTPSDFWNQSKEDQALMIAYVSASGEMDTYEDSTRSNTPQPMPTFGRK